MPQPVPGANTAQPAENQDAGSAALGLKESARLFIRTWPYLRPQLRHLVIWISLTMVIEVMFIVATLVGFDLFNNKILVGEKLEPAQAEILWLDESYAADETIVEDGEEPPMLSEDQRRVVRDRLMILFAITTVILLTLAPSIAYYRTWILQRINQFLRVTMIERAEHLSLRYHSHARTGDAIYRVYQDSAMITSVVQRLLLEPINGIAQMIFSLIVITIFSPVLAVMFVVGALPILWLVAYYTPRLQQRSRVARNTNSDLTSRIQEAFQAIRIVKANRAERIMGERFDHDSLSAIDAAFYFRLELVLMRTFVMLLASAMIILAQFLMASWTVAGDETFLAGAIALVGFAAWNLGAFSSAQVRVGEFVGNGRYLVAIWGIVQDMVVGLDRAFFLLDLEPEVVDRDGAVQTPEPIQEVSFQGVTFGYTPSEPILKGVDLTARAGTITAIVGATGSGKTTLMSLLLRLYDPDAGNILINDTDLRDIRIDDFRAKTSTALQQNVLFAASVADNISYATPNTSREAIVEAARIAEADSFIRELADGYDTELGERGSKLSSGQRQRLTIARAVVRDTPILILDEPTASLDAETEQRVLQNLANWGRDRIVFLITHRLSTIRNADQIAFLNDGKIVEFGSHDDLMQNPNGYYRGFVEAEVTGRSTDTQQGNGS